MNQNIKPRRRGGNRADLFSIGQVKDAII